MRKERERKKMEGKRKGREKWENGKTGRERVERKRLIKVGTNGVCR